jgi:hypothetical protein
MNSCKYLWLKVFYSSPSIFLFFFVLFLADGINANAASAAEHEHRLAAEIASLKEKFMDDCLVDSIYPCNLAPTPLDERVCLMRLHWNKEVEKVMPSIWNTYCSHDIPNNKIAHWKRP